MTQDGSGLERADVVAKARRLRFNARRIVEGLRVGTHRSRRHGSSVEFSEHRDYIPGDDIRHIDWKLVGKSDRYYVKRYQDETNLDAWIVVDSSASMAFSGASMPGRSWWPFKARGDAKAIGVTAVSKHDYAVLTAAALAWMFIGQGDAVGIHALGVTDGVSIPPRAARRRPHMVMEILAGLEPVGRQEVVSGMPALAAALRRRSVVFILSDLLAETDALVGAIKQLRTRRNDVIVMQIMHPHEIDLPYSEVTRFIDPEGDDRAGLIVDPRVLREDYRSRLQAFLEETRHRLVDLGVDYRLVKTSVAVEEVLGELLARRALIKRRL